MHHPGDMAVQTINSGGSISPLAWMIILAVFGVIVYFFYWLFTKGKKRW